MRNILKERLPIWTYAAAAAAIIVLAGITEYALGRKLWGVSGQPGLWSGDIWSAHNSQYAADPYTFSHITHGILLYALFRLIAGQLPRGARFVMAVAAESGWEVLENTDMVIRRYRAATISLHYYGDSIVNSMSDIMACVAGFLLAALLPTRVTVIAVVLLEITLALWIRDNLFLNILMLIHPVRTIRTWQLQG